MVTNPQSRPEPNLNTTSLAGGFLFPYKGICSIAVKPRPTAELLLAAAQSGNTTPLRYSLNWLASSWSRMYFLITLSFIPTVLT